LTRKIPKKVKDIVALMPDAGCAGSDRCLRTRHRPRIDGDRGDDVARFN